MKTLFTVAITLFLAACLTTGKDPTKPLEEPIVNQEKGYSYQSPVDPAEFETWEMVSEQMQGFHPMYGMLVDRYYRNPDPDAAFAYVNCFYMQVAGLASYCLVSQDLCLHAYRLESETDVYVPTSQIEALEAFKKDLDEVFGIETVIPTGT